MKRRMRRKPRKRNEKVFDLLRADEEGGLTSVRSLDSPVGYYQVSESSRPNLVTCTYTRWLADLIAGMLDDRTPANRIVITNPCGRVVYRSTPAEEEPNQRCRVRLSDEIRSTSEEAAADVAVWCRQEGIVLHEAVKATADEVGA